jgi:S-methylmethionine-dependent homocysteine/selenocysteine methylase
MVAGHRQGLARLLQTAMTQYVTDGGLETDLIFHSGADLPEFAAFPLVEDEAGRALLTRYYDAYAGIAAQAGVGLLLEAPTWRANPDWATKVGYDPAALDRVNRASVELMQGLREKYERDLGLTDVKVGGMTGPRGDGYVAGEDADPDEAAEYHAHQARSQAAAGADLMTALTFTGAGEAIGFVRAVRDAGVPVAVGFTVETDGRLPDGTTLRDAVARVDAAAAPDYYVVNCAHPTHVAPALASEDGSYGLWLSRIEGLRPNASRMSHAELDEAPELDEGDPVDLAARTHDLRAHLPNLRVVGGCCGTDSRHVAALWGV